MGKQYTQEERARLAAAVLDGMAGGLSLRKAAKAAEVPPQTFLDWCTDDPALAGRYARAREAMIDVYFDELMDTVKREPVIADGKVDNGEVQHRRLYADTLKWALSKVAPKRYGDRVEIAGDPDAPVKASLEVRFVEPGAAVPIKADD